MRQEIALESDGAPVVRAFRSVEGQLVFRYLTVRAGGMSVWAPVDDEILRSVKVPRTASEDATLEARLRAVALALARSLSASEAERLEHVGALEEQVEALSTRADASERELAIARERIAELERDLSAQERAKRPSKASEAARAKREAAAA